MFGKRSAAGVPSASPAPPRPVVVAAVPAAVAAPDVPVLSEPDSSARRVRAPEPAPVVIEVRRSDEYYQTKSTIFGALIEAIDLSQLSRLDAESAREEIR